MVTSLPIWDVEDFDSALLEGRFEAHWNKAASCPKCGTVCALSWNCDFCGHRLLDCSPRLRVAEPMREPRERELWEIHVARQTRYREQLAQELEHLERDLRTVST